ncbi:diguanylate phosphodiesterase [Vibrio sp.]|uniref:diguanylate phosphodiesterase n=1 Tax=Vibrio sp. TaxID=678 RepID=UPI003D0F5CE4
MDSFTSLRSIERQISRLMLKQVTSDDDKLVYDAFCANDIRQASQAIRSAKNGDVVYQHLSLRFGGNGEQSVFEFDLSEPMRSCLDLFSLYLALRQVHFQLETFHPDLISELVVPLHINAVQWPDASRLWRQILRQHRKELVHLIPSIQFNPGESPQDLHSSLAPLRELTHALWYEIRSPEQVLEPLATDKPDAIKLSLSLETKHDREALLPVLKFLRRHKLTWVAARVGCQNELNQFKMLGATYYFGYFSDIPVLQGFKSLNQPVDNSWLDASSDSIH